MANLDYALAYAARGWKVFPLQPNTKVPFAGSSGVKEATDDADTIKAWWKVHPDANIGLACGEPSGVWVVDIDRNHKPGVDGFETLHAEGIDLPETIYQDTPNGGRHYFYSATRPVRNKNNFKPGIDIRGTGYYVVMAPSTINGVPYILHGEMGIAPFPDEMRPSEPVAAFASAMPWDIPTPTTPTPKRELSVRERASAYLAEVDPAVQGCGGHNSLMWAASALVVGFKLTDAEALDLLWSEYNPRCVPPWNREDKRERKDFERKVTEARKKPVKPYGWLLEQESPRAEDDVLEFAGTKLAESFLEVGKKDEAGPVHETPVLKDIPDELLNPPGLVGDIARWINETAGCYQPVLALGASITFCGALFGRKVKDESGGRTNVYGMGVGHSSAGKDHAMKCIARIVQSARAESLLGGEVTSDTAVEVSLLESPTKLFMMDEVGHFLRTINQAKGTSPHLKTIVPMFMKLFSSSGSLYIGKQKAQGAARQIDQPCVCIWGVTSPQILYDNMTREELEGGWTARNLVFITDTRPEYQFRKESQVPNDITAMVAAWHSRTVNPPNDAGDLAHAKAWQIVVPTATDALAVFKDFGHKAHEKMLSADKSGDVCNYLWGKALENARRIALIVACGESYDGIEIGAAEARYGCELVEWLINRLSDAVHNNVAETTWEHDKQKIHRLIAGTGLSGIGRTELTRKTQWVRDARTRRDYLTDLMDGGLVVCDYHAPDHGGKAWFYAVDRLPKSRVAEILDRNSARKETEQNGNA